VEILAAGTFTDADGNKATFTEEDLDEIVKNFEAHKDSLTPPMVVGHNDGDNSTLINAMTVGAPVVGYASRIAKVATDKGSKLVADFADIAEGAVDKIGKTLKRLSAEVYNNYKDNKGVAHGKALRRVSLVGIPSIKELTPLSAANIALGEAAKDQPTVTVMLSEPAHTATHKPTGGNTEMTLEQALQRIADLTAKLGESEGANATIKAELDTVKATLAKLEEAKKEEAAKLEEAAKKAHSDEIAKFTEDLVKEGKLAPARKAEVVAMLGSLPYGKESVVKFGEGKEAVEMTPYEKFKAELTAAQPVVKFGEVAGGGGHEDGKVVIDDTQKTVNEMMGIGEESFSTFSEGKPGSHKKEGK